MRVPFLLGALVMCGPVTADPVTTTGYFTHCVSDSCEIVVDGIFAYADGGSGTPTDVMIALYEMDEGVQALRLIGDITLRDDGFADLIVTEFTTLPDDPMAGFIRSIQGRWTAATLAGTDAEGVIVDIDGFQWVEIRPQTARARWKILPSVQCPAGAALGAGGFVFTLTPWRDEDARPGCWQIVAKSGSEMTLRDLAEVQDPLRLLRALP